MPGGSFNTKEFNKIALKFSEKHDADRRALEKCLESKVNDDINFICRHEKSAYLKGVADFFCKKEYDLGVKCQKKAGEKWASECFEQNAAFGKCCDETLRKLYIFNMEHNQKNPAAVPS